MRSGMLCLLNFSCPGNSVQLPVVGGLHWMGMAHSWGAVWDPGGVFGRPVSEGYWLLENN